MIEVEGNRIRIKDAKVIPALKNFGGIKFGSNGSRDFMIMLDEEQAAILSERGYNITYYKKHITDKDGNETIEVIPELKIKLRVDKFAPDIKIYFGSYHGVERVMSAPINNRDPEAASKIAQYESNVDELDRFRFLECAIAFTPYNWSTPTKSGTSAYLKTMYVVVPKPDFEDLFEEEED